MNYPADLNIPFLHRVLEMMRDIPLGELNVTKAYCKTSVRRVRPFRSEVGAQRKPRVHCGAEIPPRGKPLR